MERTVFYSGGGFEVSESMLKTPRKTYALGQVEYVSVSRPLLLFAGLPAAGIIGFAITFRRYLYAEEIGTLVGCAIAALAASLVFGTLRVCAVPSKRRGVSLKAPPSSSARIPIVP
ncbi:hypothetical protein [Shinella sp.]|uniref:hypothetical protein n=1 Tax=Shinella sp. TaxID=1870904 RepID=UPI0029A94131|nr:hypothetical protein [Shinella sp.]MDX3973500.1 hypothetical protein [Shinella sp.]